MEFDMCMLLTNSFMSIRVIQIGTIVHVSNNKVTNKNLESCIWAYSYLKATEWRTIYFYLID